MSQFFPHQHDPQVDMKITTPKQSIRDPDQRQQLPSGLERAAPSPPTADESRTASQSRPKTESETKLAVRAKTTILRRWALTSLEQVLPADVAPAYWSEYLLASLSQLSGHETLDAARTILRDEVMRRRNGSMVQGKTYYYLTRADVDAVLRNRGYKRKYRKTHSGPDGTSFALPMVENENGKSDDDPDLGGTIVVRSMSNASADAGFVPSDDNEESEVPKRVLTTENPRNEAAHGGTKGNPSIALESSLPSEEKSNSTLFKHHGGINGVDVVDGIRKLNTQNPVAVSSKPPTSPAPRNDKRIQPNHLPDPYDFALSEYDGDNPTAFEPLPRAADTQRPSTSNLRSPVEPAVNSPHRDVSQRGLHVVPSLASPRRSTSQQGQSPSPSSQHPSHQVQSTTSARFQLIVGNGTTAHGDSPTRLTKPALRNGHRTTVAEYNLAPRLPHLSPNGHNGPPTSDIPPSHQSRGLGRETQQPGTVAPATEAQTGRVTKSSMGDWEASFPPPPCTPSSSSKRAANLAASALHLIGSPQEQTTLPSAPRPSDTAVASPPVRSSQPASMLSGRGTGNTNIGVGPVDEVQPQRDRGMQQATATATSTGVPMPPHMTSRQNPTTSPVMRDTENLLQAPHDVTPGIHPPPKLRVASSLAALNSKPTAPSVAMSYQEPRPATPSTTTSAVRAPSNSSQSKSTIKPGQPPYAIFDTQPAGLATPTVPSKRRRSESQSDAAAVPRFKAPYSNVDPMLQPVALPSRLLPATPRLATRAPQPAARSVDATPAENVMDTTPNTLKRKRSRMLDAEEQMRRIELNKDIAIALYNKAKYEAAVAARNLAECRDELRHTIDELSSLDEALGVARALKEVADKHHVVLSSRPNAVRFAWFVKGMTDMLGTLPSDVVKAEDLAITRLQLEEEVKEAEEDVRKSRDEERASKAVIDEAETKLLTIRRGSD